MGIRDFFRRKDKTASVQSNTQPQSSVSRPLSLKYKSGETADVFFQGLEQVEMQNGNKKSLEKVRIIYTKSNGEFEKKILYVEPIMSQDENGNSIDMTKRSYTDMSKGNMSLVKGFFQREQLGKLPTDYIGFVGQDKNGNPNRSYDQEFYSRYKTFYKQKKARQEALDAKFRQDNQRTLQEELMERVNFYGVNIKTSHPEDLTPDKQYYINVPKNVARNGNDQRNR